MKKFGQLLSGLGLLLGAGLAVSIVYPGQIAGLSWIVAVGMAKLALASSLGLIAAGAVVQRVAAKSAEREQIPPPADR